MANIIDYLDWRGDLSFAASPFCTVDALILAQLGYILLDGIVPGQLDRSVTLAEAADAYEPELVDQSQRSFCYEQDQVLLQKLGQSERFGEIRLSGYVSRTGPTEGVQFAAMTCTLPDGIRYVTFRGTDGSIAGWKEDFSFSYLSETPGQKYALEYLRKCVGFSDGEIWTGGHSKGGNFAVYAAVCIDNPDRITRIYNFDGPGFRDEFAESERYKAVQPKIISLIPQSSLVGQLLTSNTVHRIVTSKAVAVGQHLAYAWEVMGNDFVYADELSRLGVFINQTMTGWLAGLDDKSRELLTEAIFEVISASDSETFYQINQHKLKAAGKIIKAIRKLDPERQALIKHAIALLARQSKEALFPEKAEKTVRKQKTDEHNPES